MEYIRLFVSYSKILKENDTRTVAQGSDVACSNRTNISIFYKFIILGCSTPDYFGQNCSLSCPVSCNNSRCHIETGNCFGCEDGFQGPKCEQSMYH